MKWPERLGFEKSVAAWFEMKACISRSVNKQIQPLDQNTWLEDVTFAQHFEMIFFFTNNLITYEESSTCLDQNTPRQKTMPQKMAGRSKNRFKDSKCFKF